MHINLIYVFQGQVLKIKKKIIFGYIEYDILYIVILKNDVF